MRASTFLLSLAALLSSVSVQASPSPRYGNIDAAAPVKRSLDGDAHAVFSKRETNANRLARGLSPLKPRFETSRTLPGRSEEPSRVITARTNNPSAICKTGEIKVMKASDNTVIGYVKKAFSTTTKRFGITSDASSRLTVTFVTSAANPFDITMTNGPDSAHPFLGYATGANSAGSDISSGSPNYLVLTGSSHTGAGSAPSTAGNSISSSVRSESTIWTYNAQTGRITPSWVNSASGTPSNSKMMYYSGYDALALTGDISTFQTQFSGAFEVYFVLV